MARPYSRRELLIAGGAAGLSLPALLAACGSSSSTSSGNQTGPAKKGSTVNFINWPLYIEGDDASSSPTLKGFTAKTGVKVDYRPEIDGNDTFYTKYGPLLDKGEGIGADLIVLTSWMASRFIRKKYVQAWNPANFPNKANVIDAKANPTWDPGRQFSIPWAIGQTGIAYFPDKVGGKITSITDLLVPKLKNRVSLLDEMRDTIGLFMLDMDLDPSTGSLNDALSAVDKIKKYRDAGQFRKIVGNSYTDDLQSGEVWAALAWSGDIANLKKDVPNVEFVLPAKGAMSFTDNAMVPIKAPNKAGAEALMNYVYDPKIAGPLYESIVYVPPVKGAQQYMTAAGQANTFINPPADAKLHDFRDLTDAEDATLAAAYLKATQL
jgi:spermidine/putrescine transport system substrate-binding protein